MQLADRLMNFVGKSGSDADFRSFLAEYKTVLKVRPIGTAILYESKELGFSIFCERSFDLICIVMFFISSWHTRERYTKPYCDVLPMAILHSDDRAEVRRKIGVVPSYSTPDNCDLSTGCNSCVRYPTWTDRYELPPRVLAATFADRTGRLDTLSVLAILSGKELVFRPVEGIELKDEGKELNISYEPVRRKVRKPSMRHKNR